VNLRIRRRTYWELAHRERLDQLADELLRFARAPDRAVVDAALREMAAGLARSPFWVARLSAAGLAPGDLQSVGDLEEFPLLDRAGYAAAWEELPVLGVDDVVVVKSSGTTGDPVHVIREPFEQIHMWGVLGFWLAQLGLSLPPRPRVVLLDALPSGLEYSVRARVVGDGRGALHRISLMRPRPRERLERAAPAVVFADPAGIHWWIAERPRIAPRLVLTSAQRFSPAQRRAFAQISPAPVLNYYATTETGPLAWECLREPERFHVLAPEIWIESVDGELVVTRLRPTQVPLLRYRTGDRGAVVEERCPCGFSGWSVVGLDGRRACFFVRPDGAPVDAWQLAWLFKQVALDRFRLEQVARDRFVLQAAFTPDEPRLLASLKEAFGRLGWPACEIERAGPPDTSGGKPEPFRCSI